MPHRGDRQGPHAGDPLEREIEFHLFWYGTFSRPELERDIGLGKNRLTEVLEKYGQRAAERAGTTPDAFWDRALKRRGWYTAPSAFQPIMGQPSVPDFLIRLARIHGLLAPGMDDPKEPPPPYQPLADALPELDRRAITPNTLRAIVRAMVPDPRDPPKREKDAESGEVRWNMDGRRWQSLDITYIGAGGARRQRITPHSFTHDTFRWASRCLVQELSGKPPAYRDVVLDRVAEVHAAEDMFEDISTGDADWQQKVTIELIPRPGLSSADQKRIALQYGMKQAGSPAHCLRLSMRRCFVVYFLKRLQLETDLVTVISELVLPPTGQDQAFNIPGRAPFQQPLTIANPAAVRGWIPKAMRIPPQ